MHVWVFAVEYTLRNTHTHEHRLTRSEKLILKSDCVTSWESLHPHSLWRLWKQTCKSQIEHNTQTLLNKAVSLQIQYQAQMFLSFMSNLLENEVVTVRLCNQHISTRLKLQTIWWDSFSGFSFWTTSPQSFWICVGLFCTAAVFVLESKFKKTWYKMLLCLTEKIRSHQVPWETIVAQPYIFGFCSVGCNTYRKTSAHAISLGPV